jgi:hypothetical protein
MCCHPSARLPNRKARATSPLPARCAVAAIALLTCAVAHAAPLPPQQLTVAFTNAFPNGSVDTLTMPSSSSAAIAATNPLLTGGTWQNLYTALTWVTNPGTSTLDLIYADAEQHKIWRLAGPSYQTPTVIFSWSGRGSGPPYPLGLAADPAGNVYVISPSCAWDKPGVWVIPIIATGANAGAYGAPLLIDNTFADPITHKPTTTLALAEVAVAASAASSVGVTTPAWNALDLLVLVGDTFSTRVIRYSLTQIDSVLSSHGPFQGPASTVVTQTQFLTQAIDKIPPVAVGMDIAQDPTTRDVTLLFSTAGGRILNFDSAKNAFITPYAVNLGWGLTRLKVGTFRGVQYVFVGQLPGAILEFAAPPPGTSDTKAFAAVTKGVNNPADLAVTNSGSTQAGSCVTNPSGCSILPQLSLQITGPGTVNIPANAPIVADSCTLAADPRVTMTDGDPTYNYVPLNLGTFCPSLANVLLSANVFGGSGPTGTGMYVAKITSGLNQYENINNTLTTPINNTLTAFTLNPGLVLGSNPPCGSLNGPVAAWGPLPGSESMIPEGTLIDITVACTSDPPPAGKGNHPSVLIEGTVVAGLNAAYIDSEFGFLQQALNQIVAPQVQPPLTQIVDPTNIGIVSTIQLYITTSLNYFNQQNYNCALNTLATAARYVNTTATANPGDFIAGPPPNDDENPSGTLIMRFDHLYYDVNIFAGNPPITTDALNPLTIVPTCAGTGATILFDNTGGGLQTGYYVFGQEDAADNYAFGFLFTPTASGNLASISAPMGALNGPSGTVTVSIYTNNAGTPGTLLDTLTATVGTFNPLVVNPIVVFPSTNNPSLSTGQSYWIVASSTAPAGALPAEIGWDANSTVPSTATYITDNGKLINGACCGLEGAVTLTSNPWVGTWVGPITSTCGSYSGPSSDVITVSGPGQLNFAESTNIGPYDFIFTYSGNTATSTTYGGTDTCTLNGNTISCSYPPACQTAVLTRQVLQ